LKAAYTTDLWYITRGTNDGVSKLIGDAFRDENLSRLTADTLQDQENLILIGIVSVFGLRNHGLFEENHVCPLCGHN
jgi:hypothetical protein